VIRLTFILQGDSHSESLIKSKRRGEGVSPPPSQIRADFAVFLIPCKIRSYAYFQKYFRFFEKIPVRKCLLMVYYIIGGHKGLLKQETISKGTFYEY
jgi:hypothetical protein